jgi:NitT/TauT family transport system substrate-binding protein
MKCLCVVITAFAATLCANPSIAAEKITYLLPAPPSLPAFAPWVLAKHLGYYSEAGYDVEFVVARGGVDVAKQVGVGNAPIGGAIGDTPVIVRGNGVPVKAVGLMGGGALTVVVGRKDRGIEKIEDLKGKKISVLSFADTTYYALLGALASKNISKNDVNAQAVGPAAVASLVVAGTVDACACTPDWEIDVREGVKDTVSLPTKDYFQSMSQAILASDKMIAERPDMVRAIVKATLRGMKYVMDDPAKAATAYVEASPSFKGKEELMKKILANYKSRTYEGQSELGAMDPQRLAKVQAFYKQQGFIEAELPLDQLYSNAFIK